MKEREGRRNERLKERAKEDNRVERKREEHTKWRPVSKEIDWKKESLEKKKEINRRVGAPSDRSGRSEVKVRSVRRHGESDSSDEDIAKPKIPSLMSIITKDAKKDSVSIGTTPVERTENEGKNRAELPLASRKRKLQQTEEEEDAKRKPKALDKLEQKLKERKQQKQLPPPPPPRSKETEETPEGLSSLKKIEQRLKERREKNRKESDPRTPEGRKEMIDEALLKRKQVKGNYIFFVHITGSTKSNLIQ